MNEEIEKKPELPNRNDFILDKSPSRIQRMFNQIAPKYDFLNHFLSLGIDYSWRRRTVRRVLRELEIAKTPLAFPILDVATGTGDLAIEFARQIQNSTKRRPNDPSKASVEPFQGEPLVRGVDFSQEMLEIGVRKLRKANLETKIRLTFGDGLNLPFDSESFSAVSIAFGLRNMSETDRGIAEMVRVCRPGGIVAVLEFSTPRTPIFASIYRLYSRSLLPKFGEWIGRNDASAYRYLPESVSAFDDVETVCRRFRAAGLKEVRALSMTFGVVALYLGRK